MNRKLRMRLLPWVIGSLFAASTAFAQNTSSSLSGRIVDGAGKPVAGATVEIVHVPSGTSRTVLTDAEGRYSAQGLRVGGPFDIKASGDNGAKAEQDDVYLQLAEDTTLNLTVAGATNATELTGVTVTAAAPGAIFQADNKGLSTNISQAQLKVLPNPDRSIQAVARLDPFITLTNNNSAGGLVQISAFGQNNRYNNITIDAVPTNDSFGLEANGLPALNQPISFDAIEEYNISTANYDVTAKRSVGANINIVTKSGTNDYHGSVYYAYTNANDLTGEDHNGNDFAGYDAKKTYGFTLGGPIIKDTLFFFLNYEESKTLAPAPDYGPTGSNHGNIVPITQDQLNQIIDVAQNTWGMIPGDLNASSANQDEKKYLAKIDWNINDAHRLSFRASETKSEQPILQGFFTGSRPALGLSSYWYTQDRDLKEFVANLYDDWSDKFSTESSVSYTKYHSTPTTLADQPMVQVYINNDPSTTNPSVYLGEDQFRHYNVLNVDTWNAFWAGSWFLGDHTIKAGADFQRDDLYNLFGRTEFGSYVFNSIADFQAGNYSSYQLYQPAPGYTLNDIAAQWRLDQWGVFLQDTWQATSQLSLTYGLRIDLPTTPDHPIYNAAFTSAFGISNTGTINSNAVIEPRASFNYAFDTELKTQLRGGIGVSESVTPGVWLSNPFTNNGVTLTSYTCGPGTGTFNPNPHTQTPPPGCSLPTPEVDLVDKDFQLPTVLKMNLGFDRELPWWNLVFSADYVHLSTIDGIYYQNLNLGAPTGVLPDGRLSYWANPYYDFSTGAKASGPGANRNPNFYDVVLLTNTNKGKADYLSVGLNKPFTESLSGSVTAVLGRSTDVNSGTSSQAASSLNSNSVFNPNENVASPSNYDVRQRLIASLTWQHHFFGDYATSISGVYDGHTGQRYSWVSGTDVSGICYGSSTNCPFGLIYVPRPGDVEFANGTSQTVIDQFYNFIQHNDYLKDHQGGVTGRNGAHAPWVNRIDLGLKQEVPGIFPGNKGEVRFDIYNVLNMLNKKWGDIYDVDFPYARTLANVVGVDPATGKYVYALPTSGGNYAPGALKYENDKAQSVWSVQITLRYTF